jgi:hypothetical protein
MYKKIWGLKQLEKLGFPIPPYQIIDISKDKPLDLRKYLLHIIEKVGIPLDIGNAIGVTIRVSMPGRLDRQAAHGGLHVTEIDELIESINVKYRKHGPLCRILVQHTIDARCSGTILREADSCVIEAIPGDAPALLEGWATDYERLNFSLASKKWTKEKLFLENGKERTVLTKRDLQKLERYLEVLPPDVYSEWSISKRGGLFFYEYCKLNNHPN